tara:strand:+ start:399 stop:1049 length:651 start_codon:yes stop_codon:yes gene_type:complete
MAIIYSYPTLKPQFGDKVLGSNVVDSAGGAVQGNPTVQFNFTDIKALVDQDYVLQLESSSSVTSQTATLSPSSIQFGAPQGTTASNVQLLQGSGSLTASDTIKINAAGTYQITLTYSVGISTAGGTPYLVFRTLKDNTGQSGPSIVVNQAFLVGRPIPLVIPIVANVTSAGATFNFQMLRANTGDANGGLVKNGSPVNVSGVTEPSIATIQIYKLV